MNPRRKEIYIYIFGFFPAELQVQEHCTLVYTKSENIFKKEKSLHFHAIPTWHGKNLDTDADTNNFP